MKVPIEAFQTGDFWRLSGSVKLRIYANRPFWTSDGQYIPQGSPGSSNTAYLEIDCTVLANQLNIPDFEIDSTVDSLTDIHATYTAELVVGNRRISFLNNFAVNTLQPGDPSLTWGEIILLRNMIVPRSIPESLTRQVSAMITLAVGALNKASETNTGVVALTRNAVDPPFPIAVSANDPLWLALQSGAGMLADSDQAAMVDGRVRVTNAAVLTTSRIVALGMDAGVSGPLHIENVVDEDGFDIVSANIGDNGPVSWVLVN